ncbi:MAG: hypothetical protein HYU66_18350 [Armatimonadetes bacterium]|nr:hypothetical protein [Armatimonadota bacterium]
MLGAERSRFSGVAVVVVDEQAQPVLFADAADEGYAADGARLELDRRRRTVAAGAPYGLLVSPDRMRFFNGSGPEPVAEVPTQDILGVYSRTADLQHAAPRYLVCLVEAWLSDAAWGWRGQPVPGSELLERLGLGAKLRDGTAHVAPDDRGGLRP